MLLLAAAAALVTVPSQAQSGAASTALAALRPKALARRVAANPDLTSRVQLNGHLPGWVRPENESATAVPVSAPLQVTVVLKRDAATQAAFEQLLAAQQTPGSALYHQWLTPAQLGQMFGVAQSDLQAVENWLQQEGLTVTRVEPNGVLLDVTGSVTAVSNAFRTNFSEFRVGGETRLSATDEPSVPAALEAVIAGVHGLSQSSLHPQSIGFAVSAKQGSGLREQGLGQTGVKPMLTASNGQHFLTPNDFATIYDLSSVYSNGNTGAAVGSKAQRVAIVGRSRVATTDISQFESLTGLPSAQPNVIIPTGGIDPGTTNGGDQDEATLDVDRVMGTAPGVGVDLVVSADSRTVSGIYTAAQYEVNTLLDPVMSISFGDCEANAGQQGVSVWDTLFSAAAAEGISVMVSSGDSGAAGCDGDSSTLPVTQTASINYICSSSYVTCVGGTEFADTSSAGSYWSAQNGSGESSAVSYIPEGAWNEPTSGTKYVAAGTGGGASAYIAKPSWQTGTGVPQDGKRDVPDVALSSATHDGYLACLAYAGGDCSKQEFEVFGGTSAAAPGMAGIVALMNTATGSAAGNVNPLLYRLAASTPGAFHDVTESTAGVSGCTVSIPSMCNNSTPSSAGLTGGLAGFEVGTGFDQSTGWGSVDGANLIAAAMTPGGASSSSPGAAGSFTMGTSANSLGVTAGATNGNTLTVFATTTNGFTGVVSLSCTITAQGTAALLPGCVVNPGTATLSTAAPSGSAVVTISSQAGSSTASSCGSTGGSPTTAVKLGGLALAGVCVLLLPAAKKRDLRGLLMVIAAAVGMSLMTGCGGGAAAAAAGSPNCAAQGTSGTTAGSYVVTITGKSGSTTASTTFNLTVQ